MPFISIRSLLRDPKAVFEQIESEGEPFVITRRGQPVATLNPIAPSQVEASVLAAAPEFINSRREAEFARSEGRTEPVDVVLQRLGLAGEESPASTEFESVAERMARLFGVPVAEQMSEEASARIDDLTREVVMAIAVSDPEATSIEVDDTERIRMMNGLLFSRVLDGMLEGASASVAATLGVSQVGGHSVGDQADALFGKPVADEALERASDKVKAINEELVRAVGEGPGGVSLMSYEIAVRVAAETAGSIAGLDVARHLAAPTSEG